MPRKQDIDHTAHAERVQAHREQGASERLLSLGADALDARPWRPSPAPPTAVDLLQFAVWRCDDLDPEDILNALALLPAARAEVEGLESGLLFIARSAGLTWAQMAHVMGFNSPQACQQHFTRLTARQDADS
ncbi:DNA-binding protein [Nonomuraea sp. NEAU-A123]|uniref:DNA-binding protein n=1 Tax=Nonomuraea sp. NEAU-A123 TaxID=2839649 RepID=UPI001BE4C6CA|nr:DNA-binding protein [Nonomuraea sp. NEAU-A123]MBT2225191.1 DNA-binding protein [Nonomuraea sp. NEAU-A123]